MQRIGGTSAARPVAISGFICDQHGSFFQMPCALPHVTVACRESRDVVLVLALQPVAGFRTHLATTVPGNHLV
jgi:hypothetical protein